MAFVENLPFHLMKNLECALRHLRDARPVLYVWADALCINQEYMQERMQQVRMMGCIYEGADHTVTFLGPCDEETEDAFAAVAKILHGADTTEEPAHP